MGAYGRDSFDSLAQKKIAIEMFYTGWPTNRVADFPVDACNVIVQKQSIPHITWEPWTSGSPYPLDGIVTGSYDSYIINYAAATKRWAKPLFIRVGHEMNGDWYPWAGKNNGGATTTGFGDPMKPDGPERFVSAYRRIHHLFDSVGVRNVSWIWCPNNFATPYESWNQPESYYPGDDVVDWIGIDGYNWGKSQTWSGWTSFYDTFKEIYSRFSSSAKPLMIAEFASTELGGDKSLWIRDVFLYTKLLFPRIKALTWFNINKETDWRINSSGNALSAYQAGIADSYFLSNVPATGVPQITAAGLRGFLVEHAYPNPFNGQVIISFTAPAAEPVDLAIVNLQGQVVYSLKTVGTGNQSRLRWNGTWNDGRPARSGSYFARIRSASGDITQKLLYLK